jgi:hypothetical protein
MSSQVSSRVPSLARLQRELQLHIVDGDASIAVSIDSSDKVSAATRLRIYSDAYRLRLIEALQANYPVLEQLMGAEDFAQLTQLYLSLHPSRHYSIRWFGDRLASFLNEFDDYRKTPWLAELATWEWTVATAFDARDAKPLIIDDLAKVTPDAWPALTFDFHPSVQRIGLTTNAAAIAKAAGNDEVPPQPARLDRRVEWLIWRQDLTVRYRSLDAIEASAIDAIGRGANFGELCEAIAEHLAADDVPQKAALLLRSWIGEQLLTTPSSPPSSED